MGTSFLAVAFLLFWFLFENKLVSKMGLFYFLVLFAVIVIEFVVVLSPNNIGLVTFVSSLFGKSADFSGRRYLWNSAINYFRSNPLIGYGLLSKEQQRSMIGNAFGSHNYVLDLLVQRGLLGFFPVLLMWFLPVFQFRKRTTVNKTVFCLTGYCCALFIMFLSEPFYPTEVYFIPIFFALLCKQFLVGESRETEIIGGNNGSVSLGFRNYNNA